MSVTLLLTGIILTSFQNDTTVGPIAFGFAWGPTKSGVAWAGPGPNSSSNQDRRSYGASFTVRIRPENTVSWETGLLVTPKGFERTEPTFQSVYLELPVRAVFQLGKPESAFRPFVMSGLVVARQVACRRFARTVNGYYEDNCGNPTRADIDFAPQRRWDVLLDLGVGVRFGVPGGRMLGMVRHGQSQLDAEPSVGSRQQTLNRVLTFMVGFEVAPQR